MEHKRSQSSVQRVFASRFFVVALILVAGFLLMNYVRAYYQDYKIRQEITALQNEVKHLEQKKLESLKILQYVASDAFVEEKARTELNMKKPGEQVAIVTNSEEDKKPDRASQSGGDARYLSNPIKWWYYITRHSLPEE